MGDAIFLRLCSQTKLERDAGISMLEKALDQQPIDETVFGDMEHMLMQKLDSNVTSTWESLHGCLLASSVLVQKPGIVSELFVKKLQHCSLHLLGHAEARVRLAAGECLGSLCKAYGSLIFEQSEVTVLNLVRDHLLRKVDESNSQNQTLIEKLGVVINDGEQIHDAAVHKIFHDSAGWGFLETSMKCLQRMIEGCAAGFIPYLKPDLLELVYQILAHPNRFVREAGFYLMGSFCDCAMVDGVSSNQPGLFFLRNDQATQFTAWLSRGLADNWSQVRLAASFAVRSFIALIEDVDEREKLLAFIVAPMCLNRYYLAEGVRLYSQETWKQLTKGEGAKIVSIYIDPVVQYYIEQTKADNHAVREAACHAIAELAVKLEKEPLQSYVVVLLDALLICFQDESWPVRDAACLASAGFLAAFPESATDRLDAILPLFWSQLEDCIPSVRQGAAEALAKLTTAFPGQLGGWLWPRLQVGILKIKAESEEKDVRFSGVSSEPAVFGVVKQLRDNDPDIHTDQPMYSCGSLAPKMGRGGGCSDHSFRRPPAPWETSDGCLQLIAELSEVQPAVSVEGVESKFIDLFPLIVQATEKRHFVHHVQFLETFCRRLPQMARGFGKRVFKPHLQSSLEPVFYSLTCDSNLTNAAAEDCVRSIAQIFGPSIIRGRIDMMNSMAFVQLYDKLVKCN